MQVSNPARTHARAHTQNMQNSVQSVPVDSNLFSDVKNYPRKTHQTRPLRCDFLLPQQQQLSIVRIAKKSALSERARGGDGMGGGICDAVADSARAPRATDTKHVHTHTCMHT